MHTRRDRPKTVGIAASRVAHLVSTYITKKLWAAWRPNCVLRARRTLPSCASWRRGPAAAAAAAAAASCPGPGCTCSSSRRPRSGSAWPTGTWRGPARSSAPAHKTARHTGERSALCSVLTVLTVLAALTVLTALTVRTVLTVLARRRRARWLGAWAHPLLRGRGPLLRHVRRLRWRPLPLRRWHLLTDGYVAPSRRHLLRQRWRRRLLLPELDRPEHLG